LQSASQEVKVFDDDGQPTGEIKMISTGDGGTQGYLEWLGLNHPRTFSAMLARDADATEHQDRKLTQGHVQDRGRDTSRTEGTRHRAKLRRGDIEAGSTKEDTMSTVGTPGIVERLRTLLPMIGVSRGLMAEAADEIERPIPRRRSTGV
jgi:hypothetical protein